MFMYYSFMTGFSDSLSVSVSLFSFSSPSLKVVGVDLSEWSRTFSPAGLARLTRMRSVTGIKLRPEWFSRASNPAISTDELHRVLTWRST